MKCLKIRLYCIGSRRNGRFARKMTSETMIYIVLVGHFTKKPPNVNENARFLF